jgi:hypothetical protein
MKFYTFSQNNSGGSFDHDPRSGIGVYVIIQAHSEDDAIERAERLGLYFDGVDNERDCPCCGDRWHSPDDGTDEPKIYNERVAPCGEGDTPWLAYGTPSYIHFDSGRTELIHKTTEP